MSTLVDAFDTTEMRAGLQWGFGVLVITLVAAAVWGRIISRPAPFVGVAIAVATLGALSSVASVPADLLTGVVLLVAAGCIVDALPGSRLVVVPLAVPGALFVVSAAPDSAAWTRPFVLVAIVLGGSLVASFDVRHARLGAAPALYAIAAAGVYATVPDTEQALVLLGVAAPLVLAAWPLPMSRLGTAGALAAVALLAWTAAAGGSARPASIVGGVASLGLLIVEPLVRTAHQVLSRPPRPSRAASTLDRLPARAWSIAPIVGTQAIAVLVMARVAGLRADVVVASAIVTITMSILFLVLFVTTPQDTPTSAPT